MTQIKITSAFIFALIAAQTTFAAPTFAQLETREPKIPRISSGGVNNAINGAQLGVDVYKMATGKREYDELETREPKGPRISSGTVGNAINGAQLGVDVYKMTTGKREYDELDVREPRTMCLGINPPPECRGRRKGLDGYAW